MLYAVFLASLGTIAGMVVFLFWQSKRAASAADGELSATRQAGALDLQLAARGRALEDRDKTIDTLTAERARLEAALAEVTKQRDELVAHMNPKDSNAAVDAIRNALAHTPGSVPHVPVAGASTPAKNR